MLANLSTEKSWNKWLSAQCSDERCNNLNLPSFLICPVQRVPRYVLLFKDLVKFTENGHPDFGTIKEALQKVTHLAEDINSKKAVANDLKKLQTLFKNEFENAVRQSIFIPRSISLKNFLQEKYIVEKRKLLLRDITALHYDSSAYKQDSLRHFFVFNDLLMCTTKKKKYEVEWTAEVANIYIQAKENLSNKGVKLVKMENSTPFHLVEYQATEEYPFTKQVVYYLSTFPKDAQYDISCWTNLLSSVQATASDGISLESFSERVEKALIQEKVLNPKSLKQFLHNFLKQQKILGMGPFEVHCKGQTNLRP